MFNLPHDIHDSSDIKDAEAADFDNIIEVANNWDDLSVDLDQIDE